MKYETIYGEKVTGVIVKEYDNVVIVEDAFLIRHVIHKLDAGIKPLGKNNGLSNSRRFNLAECKQASKYYFKLTEKK